MINKPYKKNYYELGGYYQLVLPFNFEVLIPEDDSVRLLSHILEGLNYEALYMAYSSVGRKPAVEPKILFKVLTYAYMNNIYSSREIEKACKRDINFMWLLEGRKAPDHSTIARFRKIFLAEAMEDLFYQLVHHLHHMDEISFKHLFVDGTKIEANANRYTFVWKKVVTKNEDKMFDKIQSNLNEINQTYEIDLKVSKETVLSDLKIALTYLNEKREKEKIEFVHGIGKRKSKLQKYTEFFTGFLSTSRKV